MPLQDQSESPLFGFHSLQRLPIGHALCRRQPAFESSRFSVWLRSCGFWHHSSSSAADVFAPATVERKTDHASPASFSVAFRYRFRIAPIWSIARASMKPSDRQRSWDSFDPSQLCSCMTGERFGRPDHSNPACRFMNVRPGVFYAGDRSPNLFYLVSDRSRDVHSDFRDLHLPCTQADR